MTSQSPNQRWRNGIGYQSCPAFYNAILKYGWDNISHVIISEGLSQEEALLMEQELIKFYNTTDKDHGYNILSIGNVGSSNVPVESILELWSIGNSVQEISDLLNINRNTISKYLEQFNISKQERISRMGANNHNKTIDKWNDVVMEYWNKGFLQQQINQITNCPIKTIRSILDINGITEHERRSRSARLNNKRRKRNENN